jgi:3-oxoacyl-[acyl-carrier-protein] synthase II
VTAQRPSSVPVAVTGIGIVSPIGVGRAAFWQALSEGRSGVAPLEGWARPSGLPRVAAAVGEFGAKELITSPQLRRMDRLSRMAVAASRLALRDAQIAVDDLAAERVGVVFGTALGNLRESIGHLDRIFTRGPAAASPMVFPNLVMNAAAGYIAMEFGFTGVNVTVAQAEVSGEHAVALGCEVLKSGRADVVLAGGADELSPVLLEAYHRARALAAQRGGREWSSPYDAARSGIVLGEGAALLVLEPVAAAQARAATIYAIIDDSARFAVPAPRYDWPSCADAACAPLRRLLDGNDVDFICGGANSSRRLDRCELTLFAHTLAERAAATSLTSIKGGIGEFGAAGALSVAAACLGLREQALPPLCHLETPAPGAALLLAPTRARSARLARALVCGLARGGAGVALSLRAATQRL